MYRLKQRFSGKRTVSCTYEFVGVNPSATKWRRGDYNNTLSNGESPYHYPSSSPSSSCGMGWTMPVQAQLFINKRPLNWEPCATSRSRRILHQRRIMSSLFFFLLTISYMYFTRHHFKIVNLCVGITLGSNLLISNLDLYYIFNPFHSIAMNVIIIVQAISYFRRCSRTDFIHQVHHHVHRHDHGHDRSYRWEDRGILRNSGDRSYSDPLRRTVFNVLYLIMMGMAMVTMMRVIHLHKNGGLGCVHFSLTRSIPSLDYDLGWCWGWSLAWSQASTSLEPDRIDSPGRDSSLQSQEALWAWALPSPPPSRPRTWPGCLRPAPPAGTPPKPTYSFYI